jgi:ElaA protein
MPIAWEIKSYNDLSLNEFYDIIKLRINVFVVEQNCPYPELDEKDKTAFHVFGIDEAGETVAVTRILPKGISYDEISIGRVATSKKVRHKKVGIALMETSMNFIKNKYPNEAVRISAQSYLLKYYGKFGFKSTGKTYLEDNIPHTEMLYQPK